MSASQGHTSQEDFSQEDTSQDRNPRFRRAEVKNIRITDRDARIVKHVYDHRFLQSTHIIALCGDHPKSILRRLRLLFHHGYLDRPRAQIEYYHRGGSQPMVYALGDEGADLLAQTHGIPRGKIRWRQKNRSVGRPFLEHTLAVAGFMVDLELAAREREHVRVVTEEEILRAAPEETRRREGRGEDPFYWTVPLTQRSRHVDVGVVPDRVFGLRRADRPEGKNTRYFFLEMDRATMSVLTRNLSKSSIYKKMRAYLGTWKAELHTEHFGFQNFRTLFVTTSAERAENFAEAADAAFEEQAPPKRRGKIFLFADQSSLAGREPLSYGWSNPLDDEQVRLID
jgi:hypothetical protein